MEESSLDPVEVYKACYSHPKYGLGRRRRARFEKYLAEVTPRFPEHRFYADVGCGRGETLEMSKAHGYLVHGFELDVIPKKDRHDRVVLIKDITELPLRDPTYHLVTCLDVMEHLPLEKAEPAIRELWRITKDTLLVTVAWFPHIMRSMPELGDLHINKQDSDWWVELIERVTERPVRRYIDDPRTKTAFLEIRRA